MENLYKKRLKIATFMDLNDPFELFSVDFSNTQIRHAFNAMKNELSKKRGIICFSSSWQNPVMWSHYANHHRGICLGFDVPDENLGKVHYSRSRLVADLDKLSDTSNLSLDEALKLLFTKYSHWRYEKEYRTFATLEESDPETGLYFVAFSEKIKLKSVTVGACSSLTREDLKLAVPESDIEIFKARLAFKSFRVVRQRNQKLWV